MHRVNGKAYLPTRRPRALQDGLVAAGYGSVAYVAQTSWVLNATIRDNVVFGGGWDPERYAAVVKACGLARDLKEFEFGDLTEIGERGINLSGGQKQRVSLARALYSRASLLLLDDPLSAVDAPTARHILHHALLGPLVRGRTVVLVTHAVNLVLPVADFVVVMGGGRVLGAKASAAEVAKVSAEAARVLSLEKEKERDPDDGDSLDSADDEDDTDFANGKSEASVFVQEENVRKGALSMGVCMKYLQAAGGWPFVAIVVAFSLSSRVVNVGTSFWVREWTKRDEPRDGAGRKEKDLYFANVYLGLSCAWVVLFVMVHVTRSFGSYWASNKYHDSTIQRVFGAPLRFFDTTPVGRLLNLFGKEITSLDQYIMPSMTNLWQAFFEILFIFIVMGSIAPWFLLATVPITYASWIVTSRVRASGIQLKRLEVVTKSPIYAMFSETLNGAVTIRAYGAQSRFIIETLRRVDTNNRAYHLFWASRRWMDARLSWLSAVVVLVGGTAMVLAAKSGEGVDAGLIGIGLTWALKTNEALFRFMKYFVETERHLGSVEMFE
ncbi:hypothetical protein HDU96_003769, partial [Phlyctochytrium bullatum]